MFEKLKINLEALGYKVTVFKAKEEATEYLKNSIHGKTVGFGGSVTLARLELYPALSEDNTVFWHQGVTDREKSLEVRKNAASSDIYISSVNAIAESGEIVNIDGNCNRISAITYGHEKVYLIAGKNKLTPDCQSAIDRARNIAAPLNAKRLNRKTPCVVDGVCHNCHSPERICRGLSVLWYKPTCCEFEVVLVEEELGY